MLIDWFTVGAQIVNFLILVLLLKHFLYGRIVRAMEAREARIAEQAREAEADRARARREAEILEEKTALLESERRNRFEQTEAEAREYRARLTGEARDEVNQLKAQWSEALTRQQDHFVQELKRNCAEQLCEMARRALADLADAALERQVLRTFLRMVESDTAGQEPLRAALGSAKTPVTISSSFSISKEERAETAQRLRESLVGEREILFEEDPALTCGIQLRGNSHVLSWNVAAYIDALAEELREAVTAESRGIRSAIGSGERKAEVGGAGSANDGTR
jgi:F-type H+-transporting ATPase subunit b